MSQVLAARIAWEREHDTPAKRVFVSSQHEFELIKIAAEKDWMQTPVDTPWSVLGMDWHRDPALSGDELRFEA